VEGQGLGVEHEAPVGDLLGLVAVEGVACDGVAEVVEVDADLVSPARAGTDLKQCGGFETVLHAKFGDAGLAAFGIDGIRTRYCLRTVRLSNCRLSRRWVSAFLAKTITPLVSLSSLCTM